MRYHFFLHYGWFFQNLGKEAVRTFMHTTVLSKHQNHEEDSANFCGLLRKAELYLDKVDNIYGWIEVISNFFVTLINFGAIL
jgi:hypothetical protein